MALPLQEACSFLSEITKTDITLLETDADIDAFCKAHHFHSSQKSLTPKGFRLILDQLSDRTVISFRDILRMHVVLVRLADTIAAVGPFCTEELNEAAVELLVRRYNIKNLPVKEYRAYRSHYPMLVENNVLHGIRILVSHVEPESPEKTLLSLKDELPSSPNEWQYTRENFETLVNERYRAETEMMDMITQGRTKEAVDLYRYLHNNVRFMVRIGSTVDSGRVSSSITRTTIRLAVMKAGLPPVLIDQITGESSHNIQRCQSREEMTRETERLIRVMCEAVRRFKSEQYSTITMSGIYEIERHYQNPISVEETADRLGISAGYYIRLFKKETGMTPNAYLMKIRIETASRLLRSTHYTISEISSQVGIPDANYFVKCFRKMYGITPSQYRSGTAPVFAEG